MRHFLIFLCLTFFYVLITSCDNSFNIQSDFKALVESKKLVEISVSLPTAISDSDKVNSIWIATWFNSDGKMQGRLLNTNDRVIKLILTKNLITPIIIQELPTTESTSSYLIVRPTNTASGISRATYGCIYPYEFEASFISGFSAFILYRLFTGSSEVPSESSVTRRYASFFNWYKFNSVIEKKASPYNGNPWVFNDEIIVKSLANGTFSQNNIKVLQ